MASVPALAFLATDYFDDVVTSKPHYDGPAVELVAVIGDRLVGLVDIVIDDDLATIETIAVHPDVTRRGAGRQMLTVAIGKLPAGVATLDAWTREDRAANEWYRANGFKETFAYLHVYASDAELQRSVSSSDDRLTPVTAFFHADLEDEDRLRLEYSRVYRCRRYERLVS